MWVDICDPDSHLLTELAEERTLQRLAVEDSVSHRERPKATRYSTHTFPTAYAVEISADETDHRAKLTESRVSAFILKRRIVTVRGRRGEVGEFESRDPCEVWCRSHRLAHSSRTS